MWLLNKSHQLLWKTLQGLLGANGSLPRELGQLTALTGLVVSQGRVSGTLPAQLAQLRKLRSLILAEQRLVGKLPLGLFALQLNDTCTLSVDSARERNCFVDGECPALCECAAASLNCDVASDDDVDDGSGLVGPSAPVDTAFSASGASTAPKKAIGMPQEAPGGVEKNTDNNVAPSPQESSTAIVFGAVGAGLLCVGIIACVAMHVLRRKSNESTSIEMQNSDSVAPSSVSTVGQVEGSVADRYQSISVVGERDVLDAVEFGQQPSRNDCYDDLSALASSASASGRQSGTSATAYESTSSQRPQTGNDVASDEELRKRGYSALSDVQHKQYGQRPVGKKGDHYVGTGGL